MIKKQAPGETILKVGGMLLLFLGVMLAFGSGNTLSLATRGSADSAVIEYLQQNNMTYTQLVASTVMVLVAGVVYLAAGVGSSAVSAAWSMMKDEYSVSGGASGAIFGVVGALLVIVIRNRGQLEDLNSRQLMLFAGFSIYHGVTSAGIDNMAHISGFVIGALLGGLLYRRKRYRKQNTKRAAGTW